MKTYSQQVGAHIKLVSVLLIGGGACTPNDDEIDGKVAVR
jgi:hypothetical protein